MDAFFAAIGCAGYCIHEEAYRVAGSIYYIGHGPHPSWIGTDCLFVSKMSHNTENTIWALVYIAVLSSIFYVITWLVLGIFLRIFS